MLAPSPLATRAALALALLAACTAPPQEDPQDASVSPGSSSTSRSVTTSSGRPTSLSSSSTGSDSLPSTSGTPATSSSAMTDPSSTVATSTLPSSAGATSLGSASTASGTSSQFSTSALPSSGQSSSTTEDPSSGDPSSSSGDGASSTSDDSSSGDPSSSSGEGASSTSDDASSGDPSSSSGEGASSTSDDASSGDPSSSSGEGASSSGPASPCPPDADGDGLSDDVEGRTESVDTDHDDTPDYLDADSDNDSIPDAVEAGVAVTGCDSPRDTDGDGTPDFRDDDSDGDGIPDACESGTGRLGDEPPADSDGDGLPDYLELDSDGDGLADGDEDTDHDCQVDEGETDPRTADTDLDGVSDGVEVALGSDPTDPDSHPASLGLAYVLVPYMAPPVPQELTIPMATGVNQVDLAFFMDTTATMAGEIQQLKSNIVSMVQDLQPQVPDLAVGIAGFDDFPSGFYGTEGIDLPFYVSGSHGHIGVVLDDMVAAALALNVHDGGDHPESQVAAMHRGLTDAFLVWDSGMLAPTGAPQGTFGSLRFRNHALPILALVTDAPFHNGRRVSVPGTLHDPYSFNDQPPFPLPKVDDLVTTMRNRGARVIGLSSADGARGGSDPYEDMAYLSDQTGSYVPPSAFGVADCPTGLFGANLAAPDGPVTEDAPGGSCRLIFDVTSGGDGLSHGVVAGVKALLRSVRVDVRVVATSGTGEVDAVGAFVESIRVNAAGGDPETPGAPCITLDGDARLADRWDGPLGVVPGQDGVNESALGVNLGHKVCFTLVPKANSLVAPTTAAQVFYATLTVRALNGLSPAELVLGVSRTVAFLVPAAPM